MPPKSTAVIVAITITAFFSAQSCGNIDRNIPFPKEEGEFAQPVSRSFSFSKPEEIKWNIKGPGIIKPLPEKKFNFNKLPSKPFDVGEPYPLYRPLDEQPLAWENLPTIPFNLNTLPTQKLEFKTRLTGSPKIIKAGFPNVMARASRGVMQVGDDMGLKGGGRCLLQEPDGQLWIGTDYGLWCYDGENWQVYTSKQGLTDESIFSIARDRQDRIWIGTNTGQVFVLNTKAGIIQHLVDKFQGQVIPRIIEDKAGQIWFSRIGAGIFIINTQNETIKQFGFKEGLFDAFLSGIFEDRQGNIWVTTVHGVHIIDLKNRSIKGFKHENGLSGEGAVSMLQDDRDRIWIGGPSGINIIDFGKGVISHLWEPQGLQSSTVVSAVLQGKDGKIWIGKENGVLYSFDEKLGLLEKFRVAEGQVTFIYNLMEDKTGQIWMGSFPGGCYFINPRQGRFGNFTKAEGLGDNAVWSIKEDLNGFIWIGTHHGIDVYDPASGTIKHIDREQGLVNENNTNLFHDSHGLIWAGGNGTGISIIDIKKGVIKYLVTTGLSNNGLASFAEDKNGQMWIGTGDGIIATLSQDANQVKELDSAHGVKGTRLNIIRRDSKGQLWMGSNGGGVTVTDPDGKTIRHLNAANGLISNQVTTFMEDAEGNMWIGTQKGIDVADLKNNTLTSFSTREGLADDAVWTLNERKGNICVGTTNGLTILTPTAKEHRQQKKTWEVASYGRAQGLTILDFAQNGSLVRKNGQLWAGVNNQILTVIDNIENDTLTTPVYITGINIMDRPQSFSDKAATERLISSIDTLWRIEKDSTYANKPLPTDTGFLQKNKITWDSVQGPYSMPVNLRLPYTQNYLSFNFTGTHISNANRARYRYILEGIDKNWSPVTEKAISENYRNLPPGSYTFKVSSKGMSNVWSEPAVLNFVISPPWWQTWWAYSLFVLIAITAIALFIRSRSQKLRRENRILEERVERRTAQLNESLEGLKATQKQLIQSEKMASLGELTAGIAHEIQNPLNFVNNFSEVNNELISEMVAEFKNGNTAQGETIAKDLKQNLEKISHHGKRADAIVKNMIQHSRATSGKKEPTDINALCDEYLRLAYHGMRAKDKFFNAKTETSFDISIGKVKVIPQEIGRVMLNIINNALYAVNEKAKLISVSGARLPDGQGYEPRVAVRTRKVDNRIEIQVEDNGNGIPQKVLDKIFQPFFTTKPTGQGTGLGLSLSYDIIKAHGGEIKVETKEGTKTDFIVSIPDNINI